MKMKLTFLMSIMLILAFSFSTLSLSAQDDEDEQGAAEVEPTPALTIISGFKGGSYYQMAKDMQKMARPTLGIPVMETETKEVPTIENGDTLRDEDGEIVMEEIEVKKPTGDTIEFLDVRDSDGSYYNFLKINKSDVDLTFLQYDVLLYEDMKDLKRKFKKTADIRILLPIGVEHIHLITTKDSGIEEFKDLKKKRVGIGSSLQGTNITAKYIKEKTKMKWEDVEIPYDKAFRALFNGDIDAFFFVGTAPISDLANLAKSMKDKIKLISLPVNEDLKEAYGEQVEINNTIYSWVDKPVKTYAVKALLVTSVRGQTPEQVENIKKLMRIVKANKDKPGYFKGWENVKFQEDPEIEFEYHPLMKEFF
jgi:TRAP transporter TAXI family solute receptor